MSIVVPILTSGLGNRLFQYAAAAGVAEKWGFPVAFCLDHCSESPHGSITTLFRMYPTVPILADGPPAVVEAQEGKGAHYTYCAFPDQAPAATPLLLRGYWQSPRYFPQREAVLVPDWNSALGGEVFRTKLERGAGLEDPAERARTVALHVRLGDYRKLSHHQQDLSAYYARALEKIRPGQRLHLFSDEPDLCQGAFQGAAAARGLEFSVAAVRADVESLYEMSLCWGGTICANSTFSWWGAWFAHAAAGAATAPAEHWATYPSKWGAGQPPPTDVVPAWGELVSVELP